MRLPFPERVPLVPVFYFAALLCAIQQLQGTDSTFSLCCFFYILLASVAFNVAGGFTRAPGSFIFFNATLGIIVGLCVKAYLGEPADSNLSAPLLTIKIFLFGMCMMLAAVYLCRKFSTKRALLGKMVTDSNMQTATVGCLVGGVAMSFAGVFLPGGNGSALSALNQLNRFYEMAIVLGVINTIRRSGGTRSVNVPVILAGGFMFTIGLVGYSKEGMIAPFACWIMAAASQRYKVSRTQVVGGLLATIFIFRYLVPYAQYGRNFRADTFGGSLTVSFSLLSDLGNVREEFLSESSDQYDNRVLGYFDTPQGFFDRLQMISIDDALINHTEQFGTYGIVPVIASFENLVPHVFWPNKPPLQTGNIFAHEVGLLGEEDDSTGVSFSSTAVGFHLLGWPGVFLLDPFLWFLLFTVFDSLCGDTRKAPWGLLVMVLFAHAAPEGDLNSIIYMTFYAAFGIIFAAVMGAYVMPVIGTFFIGPEGIVLRRGPRIQAAPNRVLLPKSSES